MRFSVVDDEQQLSTAAADWIAEYVHTHQRVSMVLATGNTPMKTYAELSDRHRLGAFDTSAVHVFQLDGYLGIRVDDDQSLEGWLIRSVIEPWEIPQTRFVRLPEDSDDPEAVCAEYVKAVSRVGGIDIAVLGLGPNGHLGFNEPPSAIDAPSRIVTLTEESIVSNARYWGGEDRVPRTAITAGMDVLMAAKHVILVVSGAHKQQILKQTVFGPVTELVPASFLQRHSGAWIIADKAAWPNEAETAGGQV